jgi:hypothetical protein
MLLALAKCPLIGSIGSRTTMRWRASRASRRS